MEEYKPAWYRRRAVQNVIKYVQFWAGLTIIFLGIFLGIYVGLWWAFIGGIIEVVDAVKMEDISGMKLALGICRIVFASLLGTWTAVVVAGFGSKVMTA